MGRFSSIVLFLLAACGDNADLPGPGAGLEDEIDPSGNGDVIPRYVPQVCGVASWTTNIAGDPSSQLSVAARAQGATVVSVPTAGGALTGFVIDTRMNMIGGARKIDIDSAFHQVSISQQFNRVVATGIEAGSVFVHLLDDDLGNPQWVWKVPGTHLAEPAFYTTQAELVMPVAGEDGLWLHRFDESFEPLESVHALATKPVTALASAQVGVSTLAAWSTATECFMMRMSTFGPGPYARAPVACPEPRLAVDSKTGAGVMVFDSPQGVRMMHMHQTQMGGDAVVVREDTRAPRALFDGTNMWVSYLDIRGDVIVGFLDGNRRLVTMSLGGPQPERGAYEMALVEGAPWVFALDGNGYTAHRMCVTTL